MVFTCRWGLEVSCVIGFQRQSQLLITSVWVHCGNILKVAGLVGLAAGSKSVKTQKNRQGDRRS